MGCRVGDDPETLPGLLLRDVLLDCRNRRNVVPVPASHKGAKGNLGDKLLFLLPKAAKIKLQRLRGSRI